MYPLDLDTILVNYLTIAPWEKQRMATFSFFYLVIFPYLLFLMFQYILLYKFEVLTIASS